MEIKMLQVPFCQKLWDEDPLRSDDEIKTGSQDNVVSLRVIKYGKVTHQGCHIRLLRLIYRPDDNENYANIKK